MTEKTIKITGISEAVAKTGTTYWKIQTADNGNMSCFEKPIAKELMKHLNEDFNVEIAESKGFQNIRGIGKIQGTQSVPVEKVNRTEQTEPAKLSKAEEPKQEKKDTVRAMRLTEKYFELNKAEPSKGIMLETYHWFLNNL